MVNGNPEMPPDTRTVLYSKIKELNDLLWEHRANRPDVEEWLENFTGSYADKKTEHSLALYLLSKFLYFGIYILNTPSRFQGYQTPRCVN